MKCYISKSGIIHPVEMKDGELRVWNLSTMQLEPNTASFVRNWGTEQNFYNNACKESPAKDVAEMREWSRKIVDAKARKMQAEWDLAEAEKMLEQLAVRVRNLSYAETQELGLTWRVWFNGEYLENTKTGNEFFSEEDAKTVYQQQVEARKDEIERKELREDVDYYMDESEDYLDDCVREEEEGVYDNYDEPTDFYLRRSPEYRKFHDSKNGEFLRSVLDFYLAGSGNPNVEQYEIKTSGMHNGQKKEYIITGDDKGNFSVVRTDKKRSKE